MYLFETTDPLGRVVRMKENTLGIHVVAERNRSEFDGRVDVIQKTVEEPHLIVQSSKDPRADVYFRLGAHPKYPALFVKVPVLFRTPEYGIVATAFLTETTTRGTEMPGGVKYVRYRR